jgi:protocatechuate 3,4-dioxygenase beta subunit
MNNCAPIPNVAVDLWHANATGVYSGIVMFGNGQPTDKSNQNNRALRGIQISDKNGALQFTTIVPGHYPGRTHHIHSRSQIRLK